jgi:carbonic anhydrase
MHKIIFASDDNHFEQAAFLFNEYAQWLGIDLGFQHFDEELISLKKVYAAPKGCIILLQDQDEAVGCIALRPINVSSKKIGEVKRLYVQPTYRNQGAAARLLAILEEYAISQQYESLKLDTLSSMLPAMAFYKKQGYEETAPYYNNPIQNAVYFEKKLI